MKDKEKDPNHISDKEEDANEKSFNFETSSEEAYYGNEFDSEDEF